MYDVHLQHSPDEVGWAPTRGLALGSDGTSSTPSDRLCGRSNPRAQFADTNRFVQLVFVITSAYTTMVVQLCNITQKIRAPVNEEKSLQWTRQRHCTVHTAHAIAPAPRSMSISSDNDEVPLSVTWIEASCAAKTCDAKLKTTCVQSLSSCALPGRDRLFGAHRTDATF